MKKIFIVLLNLLIIFSFIDFNFAKSYASEGSLSLPNSVTVGDNITITVNIPAEAVAYQGEISVKFSDGSVQNSGVLAKVTGVDGDYSHPGNMTYSVTAKSEGTITITVSNLNITDKNANKINTNNTLTGTVTVNKKQEAVSTQPSAPQTPASNDPTWVNTSETVYATETVNVRTGWGTNNPSMGKLSKGNSIIRTAKGSNGWDRVTYNGKIGYILSQYLSIQNPTDSSNTNTTTNNNTDTNSTTNKTGSSTNNSTTSETTIPEPTWRETGDTVYATTNMNVGSGWDKSYSSIGGLMKGDSTTRIAVGSNGWDKIKFEGKTAYVLSRLLTTEFVEPDEPEEEEEEENTETNVNKVDVTENMTDSEKEIYNQLIQEVGVLPAVGKDYSDIIYFIAVIVALIIVGVVGLKICKKD